MSKYQAVWESICKDLENEEHVDGDWIKDTFDLGGFSIIPHAEYQTLQKENAKLRECVEFYANQFTSWEGGLVIPQDREVFDNVYSGGKKARETLKELEGGE